MVDHSLQVVEHICLHTGQFRPDYVAFEDK